jgi:hypothetical protein
LSCTQSPPINACGYPAGKLAITGPLSTGTTCTDWVTGPVTAYAHRCHPISGLAIGDSVRFRWRFTSDPGLHLAGLYLDDVAITQTRLPNVCTPDTCGSQQNGSPCDDGNACTAGDTCAGGTCQPGTPGSAPPETSGLLVAGASGTTLSWTAAGGGVVYDVAGATLTDLQGGGTTSAACLQNDGAAASFLDGRPDPAPGSGFYYLVRAQNVCGAGTYGFNSASVERVLPAACP